MAARAFMHIFEETRWAAGALLAVLVLAVVCVLPPLSVWCIPLAFLLPVHLFAYCRARSRQARLPSRHAPLGVLLVGALSNAGGVAFRPGW